MKKSLRWVLQWGRAHGAGLDWYRTAILKHLLHA